jgi:phage I-like protein
MEVGCVIFGMKHKTKKQNKKARDNGFQGWNDMAVWRDFKSLYILGDICPQYIEHVTSERFT